MLSHCIVILKMLDVGICECQYVCERERVMEIYNKILKYNQIRNVSKMEARSPFVISNVLTYCGPSRPPIRQETD